MAEALSLSIEWCTHRPGGDPMPALGVVATWLARDGAYVSNTFWFTGGDLVRAADYGGVSVFDVINIVLRDEKLARSMIAATRFGLLMPASTTRH